MLILVLKHQNVDNQIYNMQYFKYIFKVWVQSALGIVMHYFELVLRYGSCLRVWEQYLEYLPVTRMDKVIKKQ